MPDYENKAVWPGWETVRVIGRGSFGEVYEIRREVFGHWENAALKVIRIPQRESEIDELISDGYDERSITSRFEGYLQDIMREYSMMADMKGCANIVYCDDVRCIQHDNGIGWDIFIKMELLTPLTKALEKIVPDDQVIRIGLDIGSALAFCEKRNVLHRDIKPQNIFVAPDGTCKLGDFGIAKTAERTTSGTKTGTYKYMAPEVYNNQPYGSRADIYSLGLVLYWLLNERRTPFLPLPPETPTSSDEDRARARRFRGEPIPAPAHGSPELRRIVLKACAYDPADRYRSAEDLMADLRAAGGLFQPGAPAQTPQYAPAGPYAQRQSAGQWRPEDTPESDRSVSAIDWTTNQTGGIPRARTEQTGDWPTDYGGQDASTVLVDGDTEYGQNTPWQGTYQNQWQPPRKKSPLGLILGISGGAALLVIVLMVALLASGRTSSNNNYTPQYSVSTPAPADYGGYKNSGQTPSYETPTYETPQQTADVPVYQTETPLSMSQYAGSLGSYTELSFCSAAATSELEEDGVRFTADYAIRYDVERPWIEGAPGSGIGESVTLYFEEAQEVSLFSLRLGYARSGRLYDMNNRPSRLRFSFSDGSSVEYSFADLNETVYVGLNRPVTTSYVKLTILDVQTTDDDTCIYAVHAFRP